MTTATHMFFGYAVARMIMPYSFWGGIIGGSVIALVLHLVLDYHIFEWGPWKCVKNKIVDRKCQIKGILTFVPLVGVYIWLMSVTWLSWWLLLPILFGALPDIFSSFHWKFPFHDPSHSRQTGANTMSPLFTAWTELNISGVWIIGFLHAIGGF